MIVEELKMIFLYCMLGILIPFIGTCFGSLFVFFLKKTMSDNFKKCMTGFACGVMIAASIWSLIIPSINLAEHTYSFIWIPSVVGLILAVIALIFINYYFDKRRKIVSKNMLMLSVTIHNIPEGMAVGVCFASVLAGGAEMSLISAFLLAIGIAIQNIPEGSIISMPLHLEGKTKFSSFLSGVLSGVVEPIASILTILLLNFVVPVLPYLLSFAAGAMIYVVVEELIPEMHEGNKSPLGIISIIIGFCLMMILDITFG